MDTQIRLKINENLYSGRPITNEWVRCRRTKRNNVRAQGLLSQLPLPLGPKGKEDGERCGWIQTVNVLRKADHIEVISDFLLKNILTWGELWNIPKEMGIPGHLTWLLRNLHAGQEAAVRTGQGTMHWFKIGKGVHQGWILSPCLFKLYAEYIMRNAGLEDAQDGIKDSREKYH